MKEIINKLIKLQTKITPKTDKLAHFCLYNSAIYIHIIN